jgi:hypothetical protein
MVGAEVSDWSASSQAYNNRLQRTVRHKVPKHIRPRAAANRNVIRFRDLSA